MEFVESLTLDSLVTLQSDVEPYVLDWPAAEPGSVAEALVLVTHIRPGGFLAAVPVGFIPEEVLAVGNSSQPPGPVGPSTVIVVPGSMLDNGTLVPVGSPVSVVVVDFSQDVLPQLHPLPVASDLHFTFDPDQPCCANSAGFVKSDSGMVGGGRRQWTGLCNSWRGGHRWSTPRGGGFCRRNTRIPPFGSAKASNKKPQGKTHSAWARAAYQCRKTPYGGEPRIISSGADPGKLRSHSADTKPLPAAAAARETSYPAPSDTCHSSNSLEPAFVICPGLPIPSALRSCESHRNPPPGLPLA